MGARRSVSAASLVFAVITLTVICLATAFAVYLVAESQRDVRAEADRVTSAVAATVSADTSVARGLEGPDPSTNLQPFAQRIMRDAQVDFVTIMTGDGIRVTHADPNNIGKPYVGTIPTNAHMLTEEYSGTLGPSVRTISPVLDGSRIVGWVSVGVTVSRITEALQARLPFAVLCFIAIAGIGATGAYVARRVTQRVTGTLPAHRVHDAVAAYESIRPLGEALRRQTHEHGNRVHTVIALLELGRTEEAIDLLAETGTQNQVLVDHVAFPGDDPTAAALLLQKSALAQSLSIAWTSDIIPSTPPLPLSAIETVSLLGNLIDNAIDAACAGAEPRWVNVRLGPTEAGGVRIAVRDSGPGFTAEQSARAFEHGYSTKPDQEHGRGVGLALVRDLVNAADGTIAITNDPTTVLVVFPEPAQ